MNTEHLMLQVWKPSPLRATLSAFLLDRQASRCTPKTLEHYEYTCGSFVEWLGVQGILEVGQITAHHIRAYLVSLQQRGLLTSLALNGAGMRSSSFGMVTLRIGDSSRSPSRTSQFSQALMPRAWACCVVSLRPRCCKPTR